MWAAAAARGVALPDAHHPEPLAGLDYALELELKTVALQAFWSAYQLPLRPAPVVAAVRPRGYRTTTKRRAMAGRGGLPVLAFTGAPAPRSGAAASLLDEPSHVAVHQAAAKVLSRVGLRPLAAALNHLVVRGAPGALTVILNVRFFDAAVVRHSRRLADELAAADLGVGAAHLYLDPTGSDYYLEARRPAAAVTMKRLFGPDWLQVSLGEVRLRFPATVFSQVNDAMLPRIVDAAGDLLRPAADDVLLDLYCGYGLFALTVGAAAAGVVGIDSDGPTIEAARRNAERLGSGDRAVFHAGRIDPAFLGRRLSPPERPELVLLDPPRQGTAAGVAAALAQRKPARVLHLACGADEIPRELAAWCEAGMTLARVVPLDLFPGTANLETLLLLTPAGSRGRHG